MISLHADESRVGASFLSKRTTANPREIVTRLVEKYPDGSKDDLFEKFKNEIETDDAAMRAVQWYFFVNMYEYLKTSRGRGASTRATRRAQEAKVTGIKEKIKGLVLMNLVLPNGKQLGQATFAECAKAGGWYAKIAKKGKPNQVVGRVLSEEQLRALRDDTR